MVAVLTRAVALAASAGADEAGLASSIPVPGGASAIASAIAGDEGERPLERSRLVLEVTRRIYSIPPKRSETNDRLVARLHSYLRAVDAFQDAYAAFQPPADGISLTIAGDRAGRTRLRTFLETLDLSLRETGNRLNVERTGDREAAARREWLVTAGLDLDRFERALNAGESARLELPVEMVPMPLTAAIWSEQVFGRAVPFARLAAAILLDRRAAMFHYGLSTLDQSTLAFLARNRDLIGWMYREQPGVFAAFARSLHIRDGRVQPPGGAAASAMWEGLVGEPAASPDRFIRRLLARDEGRLAFFYDAVAHLDEARHRHIFGVGLPADQRQARLKALYAAFVNIDTSWKINLLPFYRPSLDPSMFLMQVAFTETGDIAPPAWQRLWDVAFESVDLPEDPARKLANPSDEGSMDAAWLAARLFVQAQTTRRERFDMFLFAQRAFGQAPRSQAPDILVAVLGFLRYRTLVSTLERIGIREPPLYAATIRHAEQLTLAGRHDAKPVSLVEFQAALAIIERSRFARTLSREAATDLVRSLLAVKLGDDGRYHGEAARWITQQLLPKLSSANPTQSSDVAGAEDVILRALAGASPAANANGPATAGVVEWEGLSYRLDLSAPEVARLKRIRERQGGNSVDAALAFGRAVSAVAAAATLDILRAQTRMLSQSAAELKPIETTWLAGAKIPVHPREIHDKVLSETARLKDLSELKRVPKILEPVEELAEAALADALVSIVYALALGDPGGPLLTGGNVARRHDFGAGLVDPTLRARMAWQLPKEELGSGTSWHVIGSLLALDVGLARLSLRRIASDLPPHKPVLNQNDRETFLQAVVFTNPFELTDKDRDAIAAGIKNGRARVADLARNPTRVDEVAADASLSAWRRQLLPWLIANEPASLPSYFSLSELLRIGRSEAAAVTSLDEWGPSALALNGCLCTRFPGPQPPEIYMGRPGTGHLAAQIPDLQLRIAELLAEMSLPAALARGVLAAATQDLVDEAEPAYNDDWLSLVRQAQALSRERAEDYVSSLAADGPLVPASSRTGPRR